jgi:selenide,water dikinase
VRLSDDLWLVQTVDFFTPIVDDPYWFGQLAAANALSDIYAMGGRPLTALNLVAWPVDLGMEHLGAVLRGGLEKVRESGAELAGGHSIDDKEPKYGLAVTGVVKPDEIVYNGGALAGDKLVLTKRLGMGVLASALKNGLVEQDEIMDCVREAAALNAAAAAAMVQVGVHGGTDISGFGLAGHLAEMLDASNAGDNGAGSAAVGAVISLSALPLHERVLDFLRQAVYAGGLRSNRDWLLPRFATLDQDDPRVLALFDPQTSGGLLLAVAPDRHERLLEELAEQGVSGYTIGEVVAADHAGGITLTE